MTSTTYLESKVERLLGVAERMAQKGNKMWKRNQKEARTTPISGAAY